MGRGGLPDMYVWTDFGHSDMYARAASANHNCHVIYVMQQFHYHGNNTGRLKTTINCHNYLLGYKYKLLQQVVEDSW